MGVNIPDADFASVDILRELGKCRNIEILTDKCAQLDLGGKHMMLTNAKGHQTPLNMNSEEENDVDDDNFTVVWSRKKKVRKVNVAIDRPFTISEGGGVPCRMKLVVLLCFLVEVPDRGAQKRKKNECPLLEL